MDSHNYLTFTDVIEMSSRGYHRFAVARCDGYQYLLKGLKSEYVNDHDYLELLFQEYSLQQTLLHPSIPVVVDFMEESPIGPCIIEEWSNASLLSMFLGYEHNLSDRRKVARGITFALEYLHQHNITHGNLNSNNIFIAPLGLHPWIVDISMPENQTYVEFMAQQRQLEDFIAPEIAAGKPADARSDIYALGVILKELNIGQGCNWIIRKCLHKNPEDRFQSAHEIAQLFRGNGLSRRRFYLWGIIIAAVIAIIVILATQSTPAPDAEIYNKDIFHPANRVI